MAKKIRTWLSGVVLIPLLICLAGCNRRIGLREGPDFGAYQTRGATVYLAAGFVEALSGRMTDAESTAYYRRVKCEIGTLLERGVLTGRMFFDALGTPSPKPAVVNIVRRELEDVDEILAADPGPLVKILSYVDTSDQKTPTRRTYDLWVTYYAFETGLGSFDHFTLVIENHRATAATPPCEFSRGARVLALKYEGTEL